MFEPHNELSIESGSTINIATLGWQNGRNSLIIFSFIGHATILANMCTHYVMCELHILVALCVHVWACTQIGYRSTKGFSDEIFS